MAKINQIDKELAVLKKQMEEHCRSNDENFAEVKADTKDVRNDIKDLSDKMEQFITSADNRYADKDTEKIVKGLAWVILTAFVTALIYIVGWNDF